MQNLRGQLETLQVMLDRKEYFIQSKERKWSQVEDVLEDMVDRNHDLRDKLREIRLEVTPRIKLTNVVS